MNTISREDFLERRWSKEEITTYIERIKTNPFEADLLFKLIHDESHSVAFTTSWILLHLCKRKAFKALFVPQFDDLFKLMQTTSNTSVLRTYYRYFIEIKIPENLREEMILFSFKILENKKQEVTILNSAFSIIETYLNKQPDLIQPLYEVLYLIKDRQPVSFQHKFSKFTNKYAEEIRPF